MAGYSIKQIAALTGASSNYFRHNIGKIKGATKENFEWRLPLDGLAEFIVSNKKIRAQFRSNMRNQSFPSQYKESGRLLEERVDYILDQKFETPLEFLTSKEICALPMGDFFPYSRSVSELCKGKKIFAFKDNKSRYAAWKIPTESFAIFLFFTEDIYHAFVDMERTWVPYWKERDINMYKIANSIRSYLNKIPFMFGETYTTKQISDIFDMPKKEVISIFFSNSIGEKIRAKVPSLPKEKAVSWRTVSDYLHTHPDKVQYLYDKWARLSKEGSDEAYTMQHLLMMYEYYIQKC